MAEQQLILVDKNDKFLGKYVPKSQCHFGDGLHHRAFTIMILNKKGDVLLQKRKHKLWDNYWDLTNSHPLHREDGTNETYEEAAKRCLKREWGVNFSVKKLFAFNYFARYKVLPKAGSYFAKYKENFCENEYCVFMVGKYDGKVYPNPEVAYGYQWKPLKSLLKEIETSPEIYTPWAIKALKEFKSRRRSIS